MDCFMLLSAVLVITLSVYLFFKKKFTYWQERGIPVLRPTFPFGNFKGMGTTRHTNDCIHEIYQAFRGKSPFAGAYFTITPALVVMDLDLIKDIIIKDYNYFPDRPLYSNEKDDNISAHLLAIGGEKWKKLRRIISPTFSSAKMKYMFETIVEISNRLVQFLDEHHKHDSIVNMKDLLSCYATDVVGSCSFGFDCKSMENPSCEFRKYGQQIFSDPLHTSFTMFLCGQFPKIANALGIRVFNEDVRSFYSKVIKENIEFREKNNVRRKDFLDLLMHLKSDESGDSYQEKLTTDEIIAQSFIFFVAGFETISSTLCYALFELASNLDIQNKAREEVNKVLAKFDNVISYEALSQMQFIDNIMNETIRKYSAVPRLVRYAIKDYKLRNSNLVIEKDTIIFIPVHSLHNDPEIYPNPQVFDPSRFEPEKVQKRHPMAFLGFGDGPRHCIGLRFARMEGAIFLVNFLKNFEVIPCYKTPKKLKVSVNMELLNPDGDVFFDVRKI